MFDIGEFFVVDSKGLLSGVFWCEQFLDWNWWIVMFVSFGSSLFHRRNDRELQSTHSTPSVSRSSNNLIECGWWSPFLSGTQSLWEWLWLIFWKWVKILSLCIWSLCLDENRWEYQGIIRPWELKLGVRRRSDKQNLAHLMPWYDDFYHEVEDVYGIEVAQILVDGYKVAIDWIEQTVNEEGIQFNFAWVDG